MEGGAGGAVWVGAPTKSDRLQRPLLAVLKKKKKDTQKEKKHTVVSCVFCSSNYA